MFMVKGNLTERSNKMDMNTGEIRDFEKGEEVPAGWMSWEKGETVIVKGCCFKVSGINIQQQELVLKAISKKEAIESL